MAGAENQVRFIVVMGGVGHGESSLLTTLIRKAIERQRAQRKVEILFPERICYFGRELKDTSRKAIPDPAEAIGLSIHPHFCVDDMHKRMKDLITRHYESMKQRFCDGLEKRQSESSWACVRADLELRNSEDLKLNQGKVMKLNHGENQTQYHYADLGLRHSEDAGLLIQCNILELWMKELCDGLIMSIGKEFADTICHLLNQELGLFREVFSDRRLLLILQNDWKKIMLKSRNSEKRFADWYREGPPNNYGICHTLSTAA